MYGSENIQPIGGLLGFQNWLKPPNIPRASPVRTEVNKFSTVIPARTVIPRAIGGELRPGGTIGSHQPNVIVPPSLRIPAFVRRIHNPFAVRRPAALAVLHQILFSGRGV